MTNKHIPQDVQAMTVLVVDDDKCALEELQDIVDLEGWNAIIADSVDMALEVLEWYPFIGVVVTDVHFVDPSGDSSTGIQLISRAEARFPDRDLNFIVLSGDPSAVKSSEQIGAVAFLSKPLDADLLVEAIKAGAGVGIGVPNCDPSDQKLLKRVQYVTQELHKTHVREAGGVA
ncbi:response regulator [Epibacterium ulvae]|uniref:Response regulator receiver domain-containing protein n=1 Tax=Epibacterium ulvae TaxID=1156985 RepID=A0A1G5RG94_9RHOB|nr:response regulator [Epibacterium ulvae]SCZ73093.1 Response regulator receiver domain-containing protein [Epibacterium ulvae]